MPVTIPHLLLGYRANLSVRENVLPEEDPSRLCASVGQGVGLGMAAVAAPSSLTKISVEGVVFYAYVLVNVHVYSDAYV